MQYMQGIKKHLTFAGIIALILCYGAAALVFYGFVFSVLWGWFIVPLGIAAITVPHAIGIAAVVNLLRLAMEGKLHEKCSYKEKLMIATAAPALLLLFGYIVTLFM